MPPTLPNQLGERGTVSLHPEGTPFVDRRSAQNTKKSISNSNNEPNFTLHEISGLDDTDENLEDRISRPRGPSDWMEWQANKFASSVLLPLSTVKEAFSEAISSLGLTKFYGIIYLDNQNCNISNFHAVAIKLREIYRASKTVIEIRLKELGLLHDVRSQDTKKIHELFRQE